MENEFRFLEFEGVQIAAFIEGKNHEEHPGYHANNVLFYVQQGQLNIRVKNKLHRITAGNFCIVRKLTELSYFKTWDKEETYAIVNAMILQDKFVNKAIEELGCKIPEKKINQVVFHLGENQILLDLYKGLMEYIDLSRTANKKLMHSKTKEAILGIMNSNPNYLTVFHEFSKPVKAEMNEFMKHHSYSNLTLDKLAKLSGRSLSTFNRDFRIAFQTAPHTWILKQRLLRAKEILSTSIKKSSEIYLELGFKDLAHFSKSFKKEFGVSPSEIKSKFKDS